MSAFDAYRQMRDSTLRNGENARAEEQQNALLGARQAATAALGKNDWQGAVNALGPSGDVTGSLSIMNGQRLNTAADAKTTSDARDRHRETLVAGAQGLRYLPADQRWQAYQSRVLPVLQQEGIDAGTLAMITQDNMSDADLDSLIALSGGEVAQPRYLQGSRGALDVIDPYTNGITNVRQPERESAPSGFRWNAEGTGVEPIPGYIQGRASVAASTRAPPRARAISGGRSGPARSSGAAAPSSRPWERSW